MKAQPKFHLPQLNLPLLDQIPLTIPASREKELVHALVELLLGAAEDESPAVTNGTGGNGESEIDK